MALASAASDYFSQSVLAKKVRIPANDVAPSFPQQSRLQPLALNPLHSAACRHVRAHRADRSIVACSSSFVHSAKLSRQRLALSQYMSGVAFAPLRPSWQTAVGPDATPLRTSGCNQRLAHLGHAFLATPRNVLTDGVVAAILQTNWCQRGGSDSRPSGPSIEVAGAFSQSANPSGQLRAKT